MKRTVSKIFLWSVLLFCGVFVGIYLHSEPAIWNYLYRPFKENNIRVNRNKVIDWPAPFKLVTISSKLDGNTQKAFYHPTPSGQPMPLVVSLHSWSGDYAQFDSLSLLCHAQNYNYIHPDFRGPNWGKKSCCSEFVISDIDDAIAFAITNGNVDTTQIYLVGASGGGYAALGSLIKSKYSYKAVSVWVPITDLVAFYEQGEVRKNKFPEDIILCTGSERGELNHKNAYERSPLFWSVPGEKLNTTVNIYAGVFDGIQGPVPITHALNFYNKLIALKGNCDSTAFVTERERVMLLEHKVVDKWASNIEGRQIFLKKECANVLLTIFKGGHEILFSKAFDDCNKTNAVDTK